MTAMHRRTLRLGVSAAAVVLIVSIFESLPTAQQYLTQVWSLGSLHYADFDEKVQSRVASSSDAILQLAQGGVELLAPKPSLPGGRYSDPVSVHLTPASAEDTVRYTVDGSIPTKRSQRYREPLTIAHTTVLRFRSFRSAFLPSPTRTETYIVGLNVTVPVISLTVDPVTLWNRYSGIYEHPYNKGKEWQRDAHLEYLPVAGVATFSAEGTVRVHGGASRGKPKKSFRFTYPVKTDPSPEAGILTSPVYGSERTVVLRAGGSNNLHRVRDELFSTLYEETGGHSSKFMPFMLLLNGEIWGLYDLREYVDLDFLQRRFGPGEYDLIKDFGRVPGSVVEGSRKDFDRMLAHFEANDFGSEGALESAAALVDIQNLTDYWLTNIYAANLDWPHRNTFAFRNRDGDDRRWRFIAWDADATFDYESQGLNHDTLAWALRDRPRHDLRFNHHKGRLDKEGTLVGTLIPRRLIQNAKYREMFVERAHQLLDTVFRPENVERALEDILAPVRHDLLFDWERWSIPPASHQANLDQIRHFIRNRPAIVRQHLRQEFYLPTQSADTVAPPSPK